MAIAPIVAITTLRNTGALVKSFVSRRCLGGRIKAAILPANIAPPRAITNHAKISSPRNITSSRWGRTRNFQNVYMPPTMRAAPCRVGQHDALTRSIRRCRVQFCCQGCRPRRDTRTSRRRRLAQEHQTSASQKVSGVCRCVLQDRDSTD